MTLTSNDRLVKLLRYPCLPPCLSHYFTPSRRMVGGNVGETGFGCPRRDLGAKGILSKGAGRVKINESVVNHS
jgi:hypothetical protein